MTKPGYQGILNRDIPTVSLPEDAGSVRVIAGDYAGHTGPAHTFTPMNVWDVRLCTDHAATFSVPRDTHWPWWCCTARCWLTAANSRAMRRW
jgi:redox-sensitive bicupin YhaK (pirin superfamily)